MVGFSNSKDVYSKTFIATTSQSIVLPSDWDPNNNLWILWGAGGSGGIGHTGFLSTYSGGGGGGGGCRAFQNVNYDPGDTIDLQIAVGNGREYPDSAAVNRTEFSKSAVVGGYAQSGANSGFTPVFVGDAQILQGWGGDDGAYPNDNHGGLANLNFTAASGGSCAGPSINTDYLGTKGWFGANSPSGVTGGCSGAGAYLISGGSATAGGQQTAGVTDGANGGQGFYGTGGGTFTAMNGNPGTSNTGGGGAGGTQNHAIFPDEAGSGGNGASWDYVLTRTLDSWINTAGNMEFSVDDITTHSGTWINIYNFLMLNGTVPAGGGGGGAAGGVSGENGGGSGGNGGFPGGGGGGMGWYGNTTVKGDGADGLMIIMYNALSSSPRASVRWY